MNKSPALSSVSLYYRKCFYIVFNILKRLYNKLYSSTSGNKLIFYPPFEDISIIPELLNKAFFAFPGDEFEFFIPLKESIDTEVVRKQELPYYQHNFLSNLSTYRYISEKKLKCNITGTRLLFHNYRSVFKKLFSKQIGSSIIVDKDFYSFTEGQTWQVAYFQMLKKEEKDFYRKKSISNFSEFIRLHKGKEKAFLFLTGPSISHYRDYDFEDSDIKIICNSNVKNEKLLSHIGGVDLITFADPVYHFGTSKYAATFRQYVTSVVKRYDCYILIPLHSMPLIMINYPEINDNIIGMDWRGNSFNFPTPDNFWVKDTDNILTFLMLPIASTLAKKIFLMGADGRSDKDAYFWKFNNESQFDDLIESVFLSHPSFFRDRKYSSYYKKHCKTLEELIRYGENLNKEYYSLTDSKIPALKARYLRD